MPLRPGGRQCFAAHKITSLPAHRCYPASQNSCATLSLGFKARLMAPARRAEPWAITLSSARGVTTRSAPSSESIKVGMPDVYKRQLEWRHETPVLHKVVDGTTVYRDLSAKSIIEDVEEIGRAHV